MRIEAGWQQMIQLIRSAEQTAVKDGKTAATDQPAASTQTELPPGTTRVEISGPVMIRQLLHLAEKLMSGEASLPDDMPAALKSQIETLLKQVTVQTSQLSSGLAPLIEEQRNLPQQLSRLAEQVLLAETLATADETSAQKLFQEQPGDQTASTNSAKSASASPAAATTTGKLDNMSQQQQTPVFVKTAENGAIFADTTGTATDQPTGYPQNTTSPAVDTPSAAANQPLAQTVGKEPLPVPANPAVAGDPLDTDGLKSSEIRTQEQTPALNNEQSAPTTSAKTALQQPPIQENVAASPKTETAATALPNKGAEATGVASENAMQPKQTAVAVSVTTPEFVNNSDTDVAPVPVPPASVGAMLQSENKEAAITKAPMDTGTSGQQKTATNAVTDNASQQAAEKPFSAPVLRTFMTSLSDMETFLTKQAQTNQEMQQPLLQQSDPETVLAGRANVLLHELRQENPAVARYLEKTVGDLKQSLINRGSTAAQAETQAWKELALAGGLMQEDPAKLQQWSGSIKEMANTWSRFAQGGMDQTSGRELQMSWMLPLMDQQQNKVRPALIQVYRDKQEARSGVENTSDTWIRVATETDNAGLVITAFHQQSDKLDVRMSIENEDGVDVFRELLPELRQRLHEFWPESGVDVQ